MHYMDKCSPGPSVTTLKAPVEIKIFHLTTNVLNYGLTVEVKQTARVYHIIHLCSFCVW